jgi:cysteine desulfurase / selenocysteine lyase
MDPPAARSLFPLTRRCVFMNHAGVAPMSDRGRAAIESLVERLTGQPYDVGLARAEADGLRASIARLLGVEAETIDLVRGTADGLSLLAQGLDWRDGDNVVGARCDDPATSTPWTALRDRGVEHRLAEPVGGRITPQAVLDLVDDRTRVVALGHVQPWNGQRVDVERIGAELDRRGVVLAVDGVQSAGALRLDLAALPVDFLAAGASKWLLGPPGIGFRYCRPELLGRLRRRAAAELEESSISILDVAAFRAGVDLLLEVGPEAVEDRVLGLAGHLAAGLVEGGYQVVEPWPPAPRERSGIVSFRRPGSPAPEVLRDLSAARVVGAAHADFVRLSPHFYNTYEEVERVLDVLAPERAKR